MANSPHLAALLPPRQTGPYRRSIGVNPETYARLARLADANEISIVATVTALLNFYDNNRPKGAVNSIG
jgi:hypothetical protein